MASRWRLNSTEELQQPMSTFYNTVLYPSMPLSCSYHVVGVVYAHPVDAVGTAWRPRGAWKERQAIATAAKHTCLRRASAHERCSSLTLADVAVGPGQCAVGSAVGRPAA